MSKILFSLLMISAAAFATAHGSEAEASTDIVQRTVNFLIFAGILWYLLAEPVKNYFSGRSKGIADELQKVQDKLRESKQEKEAVEAKIEEAKKFAEELRAVSQKENKILSEKIMKQCEADLENIQKQNTALMGLEQRKMLRGLVDEIMADVFEQASSALDKEAMAQIIMKKVA